MYCKGGSPHWDASDAQDEAKPQKDFKSEVLIGKVEKMGLEQLYR